MNELKDVDVHLISFVDKAANKRTFVYKSAGANEADKFTIRKDVRIVKVDDEKRLVYGAVYAPDEEDAHGDFMTEAEVEKAAHNFLAKSNTVKATDTQHNLEPVEGVKIVESAVLKGTHEILKDEKPGTWYIVTKVENEEVWKSVKDGTYTGYSLYGFAERIEKAKSDEGKSKKAKGKKVLDKIYSAIEKVFADEPEDESAELVKSFDSVYSRMQLRTVSDAICSAIWEVVWNDMLSVDEKIAEIGQVMDDAWSKLETVDIAKRDITEVQKAGKVLSDKNMKNLQAAIEAMQAVLDAAGKVEEKRNLNKSAQDTTKGDNKMEDIKKADHEKALADLQKKADDEKAELQKKLDEATTNHATLKAEHDELRGAVEKLLEASKGSAQVDGDDKPEEKVVKIDILGSELKKKFNIK